MPPTPRRRTAPRSSPAWARRNAAARAKGYASYNDYRIHAYGRIPPGQPAHLDAERFRGHRGKAAMLRAIREGSLIVLLTHPAKMIIDERGIWDASNPSRRIAMEKQIIDPDEGARSRVFTLKGLNRRTLIELIVQEERRGGVFTYAHSQDQRQLVTGSELETARRPT